MPSKARTAFEFHVSDENILSKGPGSGRILGAENETSIYTRSPQHMKRTAVMAKGSALALAEQGADGDEFGNIAALPQTGDTSRHMERALSRARKQKRCRPQGLRQILEQRPRDTARVTGLTKHKRILRLWRQEPSQPSHLSLARL